MKKLAIVTTHPIQYNAPWFKLLQEGGKIEPMVFYTWGQLESGKKFDPGFGKEVEWDIPLLEGYKYSFINNTSRDPGSHHRNGIINPTLNKDIEKWKPDALLVFGWNFVSHFKCIRYFNKKVPILFRGDSTLLRKQSAIKSISRKLYLKWVYSYIDVALYAGSENKRYFLKYGLNENQLIFAPHAIDNNRFFDANGQYQLEANKWKKELGIEENSLTILYAGKLEKVKDPFFILDFAKQNQELPINFIIAGNGPLEEELRKIASGNPKIHFIDFQNQKKMPVVYRLADFFMLPSISETWGLSVNEAMACGRAIIVRNTCGCAGDLVKHGENGFLFDAEEIDLLSNHFASIINDKRRWKEMGEVSQNIIACYSFESIVTSIENCLDCKANSIFNTLDIL